MRDRRRCIGCEPNHLMDDHGPVKPTDVLVDYFCNEHLHRMAAALREVSEQERQDYLDLERAESAPLEERLRAPESEDDGVAPEARGPATRWGVCVTLAIILLLVGYAIGALT